MRLTTITISEKTFPYEPEELSYETATCIDIADATENLQIFKDIADSKNFSFLLFYGTLLGAIREKNFIKHDIDIDVVTADEEGLLNIIPDLLKNGFSFIRYETNKSLKSYTTLYSFRRKSVYIDVYIAYKEKRGYNLLGVLISKNYIEQTIDCDFIEKKFLIPRDYLKILKELYGKNWKTPQKNKPGDFISKPTLFEIIKKLIPHPIKNKLKRILKRN